MRLKSNSPAIDIGYSDFVAEDTDIIGNIRTINETVDLGAYEYFAEQNLSSDVETIGDSDIPVVEEPVTETPVVEEPVTETPVVEEPVTETPVVEEPVTETPVVEEPVTETPVVEEPVTETPVVEEPVTETPVVEEPVVEESVEPSLQLTEVHRFYQYQKGFHLYTSDVNEINYIKTQSASGSLNYAYEAEKYTVLNDDRDTLTGEAIEGVKPVYRFFNTETGAHLYTMDDNEKNYILDNLPNYAFEDIKYYAFESEPENIETLPVYRMLNNGTGSHLFTVDQNEVNYIQDNLPHFSLEANGGVAFHVFALD